MTGRKGTPPRIEPRAVGPAGVSDDLPTERLWTGKIVRLERLGGRYEVVRHAPAVAVLAIRDGAVLGVRQRRPAIRCETWELPAGLIDEGETPFEAATRELAEEAHLGGTLTPITQFCVSPGFTDELVHLYEATDLVPRTGVPDDDEDLVVAWSDPRAMWDAIARGHVASSGVSVLGLHLALTRLGGP